MHAFAIHLHPGGAVIKALTRTLDSWTVAKHGDELTRLAEPFADRVLSLDLSEVASLSGAALGKFVALHQRVSAAGGHFSLRNVNDFPLEVLRVTGLDRVLAIDDSDAAQARSA